MSRKTERLVNLTIALLATRRFLTKSEIFKSIEGYEGTPETKERMFERDKDDLRSLGIEIELGSFDPLFEDEQGYRINPQQYHFQLRDLDATEVAILSLAAQAWKGAALESTALSALLKLSSIGIEADLTELPGLAPQVTNSFESLNTITQALSNNQQILFEYRNSDLSTSSRTVSPYATGSSHGFWYVAGLDSGKNEVRIFRLDRISGEVSILEKGNSFTVPDDFDLNSYIGSQSREKESILRLRKGKAHAIRELSTAISSDGEWDLVRFSFANDAQLLTQVLWYGSDVLVVEPLELRDALIKSLQRLGDLHG